MQNKVTEIVLTGGPCAGKTTALKRLARKLRRLGLHVLIVPEVATLYMTRHKIDLAELAQTDFERFLQCEREMIALQMSLRRKYLKRARGLPGQTVILYDRAVMDFVPYIPRKYFKAMLAETGVTLHDARDSFKAVIHLVTAAIGAKKYFTLANNSTRKETLKEARKLDRKTLNAWVGHPELKVIDNSTGFEEKMRRLEKAVLHMLGIPEPLEIERKFLIARMPRIKQANGFQPSRIKQIYLEKKAGKRVRLRKRTASDGSATYYRTIKVRTKDPRVRRELESFISAATYARLAKQQEPGTRKIRKIRYCFVYKNQYFELDVFKSPAGIILLEIELLEGNAAIKLPPFIKVIRDVTSEPGYSNYSLARL